MLILISLLLFINNSYQQSFANLQGIQKILAVEVPLVNASLYDYTKFDNSKSTIPLDDSLNALANLEDKLVMGLYKKYPSLLTTYIFDPPDFSTRVTNIVLNPCISLKYLDKCQSEITSSGAVKHLRVPASDDILVMLQTDDYLLDCNNNYVTMDACGTFFEIHRPLDETILYSKRLSTVKTTTDQPYIFMYLSIKDLCAGKHELWLVFRSQMGSVIHFIKPFFIEGPSCSCDVIKSMGYNCTKTTS